MSLTHAGEGKNRPQKIQTFTFLLLQLTFISSSELVPSLGSLVIFAFSTGSVFWMFQMHRSHSEVYLIVSSLRGLQSTFMSPLTHEVNLQVEKRYALTSLFFFF